MLEKRKEILLRHKTVLAGSHQITAFSEFETRYTEGVSIGYADLRNIANSDDFVKSIYRYSLPLLISIKQYPGPSGTITSDEIIQYCVQVRFDNESEISLSYYEEQFASMNVTDLYLQYEYFMRTLNCLMLMPINNIEHRRLTICIMNVIRLLIKKRGFEIDIIQHDPRTRPIYCVCCRRYAYVGIIGKPLEEELIAKIRPSAPYIYQMRRYVLCSAHATLLPPEILTNHCTFGDKKILTAQVLDIILRYMQSKRTTQNAIDRHSVEFAKKKESLLQKKYASND